MTKTFVALLVFTAATALAQPIGLGVKGGIPFGDQFESESASADSDTKRYVVGGMLELRFPAGFAIEADALYTRNNFVFTGSITGSVVTGAFGANSWEFPILLKKKFGGASTMAASVRPYVGAGVSFRQLTGLTAIDDFITGNTSGEVDKNNTGFVVGGGLEIRALFLKIAPEVRFTYWGTDHLTEGLANIFKTNKAQGQFLVGFYF